MKTTEYLNQLRNIDNRIRNEIAESEKWRDIAFSYGPKPLDGCRVQSSADRDRMADAIAVAVDSERESSRLVSVMIETKARITEQIRAMDDERQYNLLYGYFVQGKSYGELALEEHYSYRSMRRHFDAALKSFEKMYGGEYLTKNTPKMPKNA